MIKFKSRELGRLSMIIQAGPVEPQEFSEVNEEGRRSESEKM